MYDDYSRTDDTCYVFVYDSYSYYSKRFANLVVRYYLRGLCVALGEFVSILYDQYLQTIYETHKDDEFVRSIR